jgi:hypothetical protein
VEDKHKKEIETKLIGLIEELATGKRALNPEWFTFLLTKHQFKLRTNFADVARHEIQRSWLNGSTDFTVSSYEVCHQKFRLTK